VGAPVVERYGWKVPTPVEPPDSAERERRRGDASSAEHGGGRRAVLAALLANVAIAVAKFVGFVLTQSSSMGSEAVHSVVDCGNQVLLLVGARRAKRPADDMHQFGHGPETFFWAFLVSVALFVLGAGFSVNEGLDKLLHPGPLSHAPVAFGILVVAMILESLSFRTARHEADKTRAGRSWPRFIRETKDPDLAVVLLEDSAALVGLGLALLGLGLSELTGNSAFDGVASLLIAVVLGGVAFILGREMKSLLLGEAAAPDEVKAIRDAILGVALIERVIHLRTTHLAPEELLVAVKVAVDAGTAASDVAAAVDEAERRVRAAVPSAGYIFVEPDVDHARPSEAM
jgi:cation diffusion facilitator family transporter